MFRVGLFLKMPNQSKLAAPEPLKPMLERFWPLVFENGIRRLEAEGLKLDSIAADPSTRRRFLQACHYGYDLAQRQIGRTVIEYELEIRTMNDQLSGARKSRDKEIARSLLHRIALLRRRQLVLRRFIDSILYGIIAGQTWVLRRVMIDEEIRAIDPRTLQRTLEIATERNREDRMTFSLVSDLSTVVQVGDLVHPRSLRLLKDVVRRVPVRK
jgi:hypothetical protein